MKKPPAGAVRPDASDPRFDLMRAVGLCDPSWESAGRLTFHPQILSRPAWQDWKINVFQPLLRPQLEAAVVGCAAGDGRAIELCDQALEAGLSPAQVKMSRNAGALLAAAYTPPSGERLWLRARERIAAGTWPGHLAVVIAMRAAAFHLPPIQAVGSYLLLEARGAFGRAAMPLCLEMVEDCLAEGPSVPLLRVA